MNTPGPIRYVLLTDVDVEPGETAPLFLATFVNEQTYSRACRWYATNNRTFAMTFHSEWTARFFHRNWLTENDKTHFRVATVRMPSGSVA